MRPRFRLVTLVILSPALLFSAGSARAEGDPEIPEACRESDRLEECLEERVREAERELEDLRDRVEEAFRARVRASCGGVAVGGELAAGTLRALCRLERVEERGSELERRLRELTPPPSGIAETKNEKPVKEAPPGDAETVRGQEERPEEPPPPSEPVGPEPSPRSSQEPPAPVVETPEEKGETEKPAEVLSGRGPVRATSGRVSSADREPEIVPMESPMTLEIELPDLEAIPEGYGWPTTETRTFQVEGVRLPKVTVEKKEGRGGVRLIVRSTIRSSSYLDHARIDLEVLTPGDRAVAAGSTDWFPVGRSLPRQAEGRLVKEVGLELSVEADRALRESGGSARLRLTVHVRD